MSEQSAFFLYLIKSYLTGQPRQCPYCGSFDNELIARCRVIIQLRKCHNCGLMFRYPKETPEYNQKYYQQDYKEGITTDMPSPETIEKWKQVNFKGTPVDFTEKLNLLNLFIQQGKVLDFGASWGYVSYQLAAAGYDVYSYELSKVRGGYAKKHLGVRMIESLQELEKHQERFDAIYTSHVIEHVPYPKELFNLFMKLLKPKGKLIAFVPNCQSVSQIMGHGFGMHHVLALNKEFLEPALLNQGFENTFFTSSPYHFNKIRKFAESNVKYDDKLEGDELFFVATKK
jgi:2-polyprenyl-3-methyl-5-hydroxy-6-metoxy-1,4-benzoquinol methylase